MPAAAGRRSSRSASSRDPHRSLAEGAVRSRRRHHRHHVPFLPSPRSRVPRARLIRCKVVNFTDVIAEALGPRRPSDYYRLYKRGGAMDEAVTRPRERFLQDNGVRSTEASVAVAHRRHIFPARPASPVSCAGFPRRIHALARKVGSSCDAHAQACLLVCAGAQSGLRFTDPATPAGSAQTRRPVQSVIAKLGPATSTTAGSGRDDLCLDDRTPGVSRHGDADRRMDYSTVRLA